jgi:Tfp pilus assembly protein PilO
MIRQATELMRKSRRMQALLALIAAMAVADAVFYFGYTAPARGRAAELAGRLGQVEKRFDAAEKEAGVYAAYERAEADIGRFRDMLPERSEYARLVREVYDMARDSGMKGSSFGTQLRSVKAGGMEQLSFSMPVSGRYEDVRRFIHDVESSELFLNIDSLGLAGGESGGDISLGMGLSTYVRSR